MRILVVNLTGLRNAWSQGGTPLKESVRAPLRRLAEGRRHPECAASSHGLEF